MSSRLLQGVQMCTMPVQPEDEQVLPMQRKVKA